MFGDDGNNKLKRGSDAGICYKLYSKLKASLTAAPMSGSVRRNLRGFFRVQSYHPSEWYDTYNDLESIVALKNDNKACGMSNLSQYTELDWKKQKDKRQRNWNKKQSYSKQDIKYEYRKI